MPAPAPAPAPLSPRWWGQPAGQDQASARFDGVAAQVGAASAADSMASLTFNTIAAVTESATASDSAASYIGVVRPWNRATRLSSMTPQASVRAR